MGTGRLHASATRQQTATQAQLQQGSPSGATVSPARVGSDSPAQLPPTSSLPLRRPLL